ncbi:MAG: hypothetical protein JXM79_20485 [Sedimentisphaerales bacterium]|nr:hypothetical protein [Sedimentisphaerales bacterium]
MSKQKKEKIFPDGRGNRPTDPNELAKWVVEQTTENPQKQDENAENDVNFTKIKPPKQ